MRGFIFSTALCFMVLFSCNKTGSNKIGDGGWQLVQKEYFWSAGVITKPPSDASVVLQLNPDNTYVSQLNGQTVSTGAYSVTTQTSSYGSWQVLQLDNFISTGILNLSTFYQVSPSGQIESVTNGFDMKISNDTLTLSSEIIAPEGYTIYTFVKNKKP